MFRLLHKAKASLIKIKTNAIILYKSRATPLSTRIKEQEHKFQDLGLPGTRSILEEELNECLRDAGLPSYSEDSGMYSEHLIVFTAISKIERQRFTNILEIGTHDGKSACILSRLFPNATITTVDLRDDDPIFKGSYGREDDEWRDSFVNERNKNLARGNNINFIQSNSLFLTRLSERSYDLIWVDGAHGYPIACSDITNAIRLLSKQGILMCDDVWTNIRSSDAIYSSIASWETLSAYDCAGITETTLLRKRLGNRHLAEKYISFSRLS